MKKRASIVLSLAAILSLLVSLFPGGIGVNAETGINVSIDPHLNKALETEAGPFEVVVTFEGEGAPTTQDVAILEKIGLTEGVTMKALPVAGVLATESQIDKLAQAEEVRSLYLNRKLTYFNEKATELTGVDQVRMDDQMTKWNEGLPVTGEGGSVLVHDSGVDGTHADLEYGSHLVENILSSINLHAYSDIGPVTYQEGVVNTDTNSGHGTHVAGTVGGTGQMSNGKYEGVAPGADLVGYGSGGALFILDAIGGFDYALTHQAEFDIRVITNSWGSSGEFDPNGPVNVASKVAYERGMVVTFAAGNAGPEADTMNPYSLAPWVISVAAGTFESELADFSSRGVKGESGTFTSEGETYTYFNRPDVTAPGLNIVSTRTLSPVGVLNTTTDAENIPTAFLPYYTTLSGTSMATPHVAGIVMLMLEANPTLSPDEVFEILTETTTDMPGYEAWEVGTGYVNAYAAVDRAFELTDSKTKKGPKHKSLR
ncbi:S8 family serine peptidase [Halobacillus shinanisalinarum]|uniref:S8 family serine peptidase n=1 Tax=Halobacillus shinanisalinarum TaxID=2932258 RepID=A0ABY4GVS6_9BACI|nr:S8 family serine peptidase [Halobacillus shinanisalinarum]UOQ92139.1 S8 family serine peptidase [Halobacillus shinanisalinarum]